jgi:hypothetical protein
MLFFMIPVLVNKTRLILSFEKPFRMPAFQVGYHTPSTISASLESGNMKVEPEESLTKRKKMLNYLSRIL